MAKVDELILTDTLEGKTLMSYQRAILQTAEDIFGARDPRWTVTGFQYVGGNPSLWFPDPSRNDIVMRLGAGGLQYPGILQYNLAHETIHTLDPLVDGPRVTVLEESLAEWFGFDHGRRHDGGLTTNDRYQKVGEYGALLMNLAPTAIKNLRSRGIPISGITADQLSSECPKLPEEVVKALLMNFWDWTPGSPPTPT